MLDLRKFFTASFFVNTMVGEEGAAGGLGEGFVDEGGDVPPPEPSNEAEYDLPTDMDIPEAELKEIIENDPDFKRNLIEKKRSSAKAEENSDTGSEVDQGGDAGASENEPEGKVADDKNSGDGTQVEFEDNVIEGLKGADFAKLPIEAQEALGKFYSSTKEKEEVLAKTQKELDALMQDPIVKQRIDLLSKGKTQFDVRGFNQQEKNSIIEKIQNKYGLDQSEAEGIFNELKDGMQQVARDMAQDIAHNSVINNENQRRAQEVSRKGAETLLKIAEFNPELAVKETDLFKFYSQNPDGTWVYNEKHPEIEKFKNGIGKAQKLFHKIGLSNFDSIVNAGSKALYAMAAAELGWPVALNTGKRDQKIVSDARRKALEPFIRSGAKSLSKDTSAAPGQRPSSSSLVIDGIDAVRLNTDPAYYAKVSEMKPGDTEYLERVSNIYAKGRAAMNQKSKR